MKSRSVLVATGNPGKLREFRRLLWPRLVATAPPGDYEPPEETGDSFRENALIKARALAGRTGQAVLADDSGLEVDVLGGGPGVGSARYGPDDDARIRRLLAELLGVPRHERTARFRCVLALVLPEGQEIVAEGTCEGEITETPCGEAGFGYDPVFRPAGERRTFGEMDPGGKARLSHRSRAARELLRTLGSKKNP